MKKLEVRAFWDEEAAVWVAESDDVPGLITESPTMEALVTKLECLIPELLELNGVDIDDRSMPFHLQSEFSGKTKRRVICG